MKAIQATPKPLGEILQGYQFSIPAFQRPYSWKVEQCDQLWTDISDFFDGRQSGDEQYFLGSIVVYQEGEEWYVVDGQQRLTTLMILIKILFEINATMTILQRFLNRIDPNTGEVMIGELRLKPGQNTSADRNDLADFQQLLEQPDSVDKNSKFRQNYDSLKIKAQNWFDDNPDIEKRQEFLKTFREHVVLLPIQCDSLDDALALFQIINDRGMNLVFADIFKAQIYRVVVDDKTKEKSFVNRWSNLKEYDYLFRLFMHISRADEGIISNEGDLRKYITEKHLQDSKHLEENWDSIIRSLEVCHWANWSVPNLCSNDNPTAQADETIYRQILKKYAPNAYWQYPLHVFIHKHVVGEVDSFSFPESKEREYIELLKNTVRYFFMKDVVYRKIDAVRATTFKVCKAIANNENYIAEYKSNAKNDIADFNQKVEAHDYVTAKRRNRLVLINSLPDEEQARKDYAEVLLSGCHIEHILPRKWNSYDEWNQESYNQHIDTIGNLVPLEWKLNIAASNEFFARKQERYEKSQVHDACVLSKKDPSNWYPSDVENRQKESIERLKKFFGS